MVRSRHQTPEWEPVMAETISKDCISYRMLILQIHDGEYETQHQNRTKHTSQNRPT